MNETMVTVVGNAATSAEYRPTRSGVPSVRFRLAATVRRFDTERGGWTDAHTSFFTVWAWRQLAENVAASLAVGEPLVVQGRLRVREYERDGQRRTDAAIDAVAIGHDLSLGTSAFRRVVKPRPSFGERGPQAGQAGHSGEAAPQMSPVVS